VYQSDRKALLHVNFVYYRLHFQSTNLGRTTSLTCTFIIPAKARVTLNHFSQGLDGTLPTNFITINGVEPYFQIDTQLGLPLLTVETDQQVVIVSKTASIKLNFNKPNFTSNAITNVTNTNNNDDVSNILLVSKLQVLIYGENIYRVNDFHFNDFWVTTDVYDELIPCNVKVNNTMLLIGGQDEKILQVYPWGLRGIGKLPFKFNYGRCETFDSYLYLCFPTSNTRLCRRTKDLSEWEDLAPTTDQHLRGQIVVYNGSLLAIAGQSVDTSKANVETLSKYHNSSTAAWTITQSMSPVGVDASLSSFSTLAIGEDIFVFGMFSIQILPYFCI